MVKPKNDDQSGHLWLRVAVVVLSLAVVSLVFVLFRADATSSSRSSSTKTPAQTQGIRYGLNAFPSGLVILTPSTKGVPKAGTTSCKTVLGHSFCTRWIKPKCTAPQGLTCSPRDVIPTASDIRFPNGGQIGWLTYVSPWTYTVKAGSSVNTLHKIGQRFIQYAGTDQLGLCTTPYFYAHPDATMLAGTRVGFC
jgi:hypothetical protein